MAQETSFTDAQQQQLSTTLVSELRTNAGIKETFCKCWPCAKQVLELILKLPGLPPIVSTVINGIIKAGDAAFAAVCGR